MHVRQGERFLPLFPHRLFRDQKAISSVVATVDDSKLPVGDISKEIEVMPKQVTLEDCLVDAHGADGHVLLPE